MDNTWRYQAYLIRMWSVEQKGQLVWRASLEDSLTGEIHGFANMELLFDFLRDKASGINIMDKHRISPSAPNQY